MNKKELINAVSVNGNLTKKEAKTAVDTVIETIMSAVADGESVALAGFGTFEVKEAAARNGVNPQTGEPIKIKAHKKPVFRWSTVFKKTIK